MIFVQNNSIDAAYHFSVEEFFLRHVQKDAPVLMIWQSDKTVMLGSNQVAEAEINLEYAKESNISIVRRQSGGGAIFTDLGTVLYTCIEPLKKEAIEHREALAEQVIRALQKIGVTAAREGKNDILIDGKKISGLAQFNTATHVCTHGSLLYDTDLEVLSGVLIADESKLSPKGISSIRSRVTNIKPYMKVQNNVAEFINEMKNNILNNNEYEAYYISDDEYKMIDEIHRTKYLSPEWTFRM